MVKMQKLLTKVSKTQDFILLIIAIIYQIIQLQDVDNLSFLLLVSILLVIGTSLIVMKKLIIQKTNLQGVFICIGYFSLFISVFETENQKLRNDPKALNPLTLSIFLMFQKQQRKWQNAFYLLSQSYLLIRITFINKQIGVSTFIYLISYLLVLIFNIENQSEEEQIIANCPSKLEEPVLQSEFFENRDIQDEPNSSLNLRPILFSYKKNKYQILNRDIIVQNKKDIEIQLMEEQTQVNMHKFNEVQINQIFNVLPIGVMIIKGQDQSIEVSYQNKVSENLFQGLNQIKSMSLMDLLDEFYELHERFNRDQSQSISNKSKNSIAARGKLSDVNTPNTPSMETFRKKKETVFQTSRYSTNKRDNYINQDRQQSQQEFNQSKKITNTQIQRKISVAKCRQSYQEKQIDRSKTIKDILDRIRQNHSKLRFDQKVMIGEVVFEGQFVIRLKNCQDELNQNLNSTWTKMKSLEISFYSYFQQSYPSILILFRDLTNQNYISELEKSDKQKSQTISFVSHEFRQPLNCIIEMLKQSIHSNKIDWKFIKIALDNAKYLLNLSNDLLDHAQMKMGKFQIFLERFNIRKLANECLEMFQILATMKNIKLQLEFIPSDERHIELIVSDKNRIKQIIINLIGNAFKFTLQGSITLCIKFLGFGSVDLSVIDTGLGIKKEDQPKLFKAFGKLQNKESSIMNKQGVGLGLLISNQIAVQLSYDGETGLQLESEFMQGTRFWFNLYDHSQEEEWVMEEQEELSESIDDSPNAIQQLMSAYLNQQTFLNSFNRSKSTQNNILVIDDNQFNIDVLKIKLKQIGVSDIDFTISGIHAEELIQKRLTENPENPYKLIFMDLEMPIQNGRTTATNILANFHRYKQNINIVACSGYTDQEEIEICQNLGFAGYLVKPVNQEELKKVIKELYL